MPNITNNIVNNWSSKLVKIYIVDMEVIYIIQWKSKQCQVGGWIKRELKDVQREGRVGKCENKMKLFVVHKIKQYWRPRTRLGGSKH